MNPLLYKLLDKLAAFSQEQRPPSAPGVNAFNREVIIDFWTPESRRTMKEILDVARTDTKSNSIGHTYPTCRRSITLAHVPPGGRNRRNSGTCLEKETCFSIHEVVLSSVTVHWFKYREARTCGEPEDRRKRSGWSRGLAGKILSFPRDRPG